jgi:hypothetical protein
MLPSSPDITPSDYHWGKNVERSATVAADEEEKLLPYK